MILEQFIAVIKIAGVKIRRSGKSCYFCNFEAILIFVKNSFV